MEDEEKVGFFDVPLIREADASEMQGKASIRRKISNLGKMRAP